MERVGCVKIAFFVFIALAIAPAASLAASGGFEYSLGFSYNHSSYSSTDYSWTRRWGTSLGYYFTDRSEIELAFQDVLDRTVISGFEDTTFHDQIYSINWVQSLTGKDFPVQPYVKFGIGQLNRDASGSYANGAAPPKLVDSVTGVIGGGLRIYFMRNLAIRAEATSYLSGGKISTWKDNMGVTVGLSFIY